LLRAKEEPPLYPTRREKKRSPLNAVQTGPRPVKVNWDWRENLRALTDEQRQTLARQRGLRVSVIKEAERRGLLFAVKSLEGWAWLVTDGKRETASWRRLDGQPWKAGGTQGKVLHRLKRTGRHRRERGTLVQLGGAGGRRA
jgi:hypothetical protein